jgi:hypothetical protein
MTVKYCIRRLCIGVQAWKVYQTEAFQVVVLIAGAALDAEEILIFYFLFWISWIG